jgi:hypothetical protein
MNIKILKPEDESAMIQLLKSDIKDPHSDYYLDRGSSFWAIYNWFSQSDKIGIGVFDKADLVGMVTLSHLPFKFRNFSHDTYLLSDFFVHFDYRKSFAAARLFTGLQTNLPKKKFIEVAVENKPGFAESIVKVSQKHGNVSKWVSETKLVTIYPNQTFDSQKSEDKLRITNDWNSIERHLEKFRQESRSWIHWSSTIEIKNTFRKTWHFHYKDEQQEVSGLLVDRGNLQKARWNGQSRILIEKYRRSLAAKGIPFSVSDELPFLSAAFVINSVKENNGSARFAKELYDFGFKENYFGINFRDTASPLALIPFRSLDELFYLQVPMKTIF